MAYNDIFIGKDAVSIGDIVKFILRYRKDTDAFRLWSIPALVKVIQEAYEANALAITYNKFGIDGVAIGQIKPLNNFHVLGVIASRPKVLHKLYSIFWILWGMKGYSMTATRHGKLIVYNTERLADKLIY